MVTMGLERSALGRNRALRRLAFSFAFRGDEIGFSGNRLISEGLRQFYERCLILFPTYTFSKHESSHCTHTIYSFQYTTRFITKINSRALCSTCLQPDHNLLSLRAEFFTREQRETFD